MSPYYLYTITTESHMPVTFVGHGHEYIQDGDFWEFTNDETGSGMIVKRGELVSFTWTLVTPGDQPDASPVA